MTARPITRLATAIAWLTVLSLLVLQRALARQPGFTEFQGAASGIVAGTTRDANKSGSTLEARQQEEDALVKKLLEQGVERTRFKLLGILPEGGPSGRMTMKGSKQRTSRGIVHVATPIKLFPRDVDLGGSSLGSASGKYDSWPAGHGSIWCFDGPCRPGGYLATWVFAFEGDEEDPLTFVLMDKLGLVYLHGKGKVVTKDRREILLGYDRQAPVSVQPEPEDLSPKVPPAADPADAPALYNNALRTLRSQGVPSAALSKFQDFLRKFPNSDLADNAQYWIGECYYLQRDYNKALEEFAKVEQRFPEGNKVPAAILKIGYSHSELGQGDAARLVLEGLVSRYSHLDEAMLARAKLAALH